MSDIQYLTMILQGIVSDPDSVFVDRKVDDMGVLLTARVAKVDMGRVIGRSGTTINAVRHIMKSFGFSINAELNVKLEEPA